MANGVRSAYTLDGLGRPTDVAVSVPGVWSAQTLASGMTYHANGSISTMSYGNGQMYSQTLNNRQLTQSVSSVKGAQKALDQSYTYDLNGRVLTVTDLADTGGVDGFDRTYSYDGFGRLKTATGQHEWGSGSFEYDPFGNLTQKTMLRRIVTNTYDSNNRLSQSHDSSGNVTRLVEYDARGNVTRLGGQYFTYDMSDQPTSISGDVSGSYVYDGNLKRVKSTMTVSAGTETIYNIYDSSGLLSMVTKRP